VEIERRENIDPKTMMGFPTDAMIFLGSPYSDPDAKVRRRRFEAACVAATYLVGTGMRIFSPIVHSHPISLGGNDPMALDFWLWQYEPIREMCEGMIVMRLPGWRESTGLAFEIAEFEEAGKPILYMDPVTIRTDGWAVRLTPDPEHVFEPLAV